MIKLYQEHPEFNEFTVFNTLTGELKTVTPEYFEDEKRNAQTYSGLNMSTHTNFPRRVYFQITRNCNLMCDYCFIKAENNKNHLDSNIIFELSEYFGKKGLMEVRLTGGEPTTHPDFIQIVQKFKKENVYVSVATNGVWSQSIFDFFCNEKNIWLIVSIDGNKEIHNKYRNNSYKKVLDNLIQLKKKNPEIRLRLNTVLTKENVDDLEHLAKLTQQLGAESITLIPLRPQVRNASIRNQMLSANEFRDAIESMVRYKQKYGIKFTTTIETKYKKDILKDAVFEKKSSCAAGREGTNLDFDNKRKLLMMYACSYCPASDLNENQVLREPFLAGEFNYTDIERFGEIWNDDSNWTLFRDLNLKSDDCKICGELGISCTGSCPIQNINLDILDENISIKEEIMKQMKSNAEWYCYKKLLGNKF
jgi:MoaA/NifB/PqqE/SkfB family radical SAM enzyme